MLVCENSFQNALTFLLAYQFFFDLSYLIFDSMGLVCEIKVSLFINLNLGLPFLHQFFVEPLFVPRFILYLMCTINIDDIMVWPCLLGLGHVSTAHLI